MLASVSGELFVALDVPKHYVVVGAVSTSQQVVLSPRRVDLDDFPGWGQQHLRSTDAVVLEATTNAWHLCDQLRPPGLFCDGRSPDPGEIDYHGPRPRLMHVIPCTWPGCWLLASFPLSGFRRRRYGSCELSLPTARV